MTRAESLSYAAVRRPSLALLALAVNLAITLPLAAVLNIWQDEAYTLQTTSRGFAYAFHQAIAFEQNAPLYFLIMTAWRHVDGSIFFLRGFSVLAAALAVFCVPALVRRYVPGAPAGLVTAVVAVNPFVIWAALEMRVYAFVILLSALLLLSYFEAVATPRPKIAATVAYALCVAIALYTQYYLAFLIGGQAVAMLLYHRRALGRFALAAGAGFASFVPMVAIVPRQVQNFKGGFAPPSALKAAGGFGRILFHYVLPLPMRHASLGYLGLLVVIAVAAFLFRRRFAGVRDGEILTIAGAAVVLFVIASYGAGVLILDRHAASLYLPATLVVFALCGMWGAAAARRLAVGFAAIAILLSAVGLAQAYHGLAKPGDWIRANAYLAAHQRPGEPIVVFEAENALPLAHYYRGPNRIVAIPRPVDFRRYDVTAFVIRDAAQLRSMIPPSPRLWLVTAGGCRSANISFGCPLLEQYLARRYRVQSDASFGGSRIRLLEQRLPGASK